MFTPSDWRAWLHARTDRAAMDVVIAAASRPGPRQAAPAGGYGFRRVPSATREAPDEFEPWPPMEPWRYEPEGMRMPEADELEAARDR